MYRIVKNLLLLLFYLLSFLLIHKLVDFLLDGLPLLTEIIVILIVIFSQGYLSNFMDDHLQSLFLLKINAKKKILENLNHNLAKSLDYYEVKHVVFEALDTFCKNHAYVFYIYENGSYYLAHYRNVSEKALPISVVPGEKLTMVPQSKTYLKINSHEIPKPLRKSLEPLGLFHFYPLQGHNFMFAFIVVSNHTNLVLSHRNLSSMVRKLQYKTGLFLESTGLRIDLERKNLEIKKLIEVSQQVLSSLDMSKALNFILDALESLIHFDAVAIFLLNPEKQDLRSTTSRGYSNPAMDKIPLKVGQGSAGHVAQTKKIEVLNNVLNSKHYYQARKSTRSQISLPFLFDDTVLGVMCVESDTKDFFTPSEVELLKIFANQAAIAIHNARQVEIKLEKQALEYELIHAGTVQKGLLVRQIPKMKGLSLTALNIPSKLVSGDIYDFMRLTPNALGFSIGDVSGKGAPAALMMALILAGLRMQNKQANSTCDVINRLNELLTQTTIEGKYATFFYGIIRLDKRKIIYTNAGHNPPFIIRADGNVRLLDKGGIVIGFLNNQQYVQDEVDFLPGDLLVAYTDGVTETMNDAGTEYGEERLIELIKANQDKPIHVIKNMIIRDLRDFSNDAPPPDDVTMILARFEIDQLTS